MADINELLQDEEIKGQFEKLVEQRTTSAVQEATNGLLNKRDELLGEKKKLQKQLEEINEKYNLEDYEKIVAEYKKTQEQNLTAEEKFQKREQELKDNFTKREKDLLKQSESDITKLQQQIDKSQSTLRANMIDNELLKEITKAEGIPELLMPVLKGSVDLVEENGEYVVRVMDDGRPRVGDSQGNPMTISQLVSEKRDDPIYGVAFKASKATGGDATGNSDYSASGTLIRSQMSTKEKVDYINKHGEAKYNTLPK